MPDHIHLFVRRQMRNVRSSIGSASGSASFDVDAVTMRRGFNRAVSIIAYGEAGSARRSLALPHRDMVFGKLGEPQLRLSSRRSPMAESRPTRIPTQCNERAIHQFATLKVVLSECRSIL